MVDVVLIHCVNIKISHFGRINAVDFKSLMGYEALSLGYGRTNASSLKKPLQVLKGMISKCPDRDSINLSPSALCLFRPCVLTATICGGDSGGPVVHESGIVGVHSTSFDDCEEHTKHLELTPGTSAAIISPVSPVTEKILDKQIARSGNNLDEDEADGGRSSNSWRRDAFQGEFPYVIRLEEKLLDSATEDKIIHFQQICTGSALTSVWVLSAAHCIGEDFDDLMKKNKVFVRYNSHFPNITGFVTPVTKFISYPGYIELRKSIKMGDVVLIHCVNIKISHFGRINAVDFKSIIGHEALSLGFGKTCEEHTTHLELTPGTSAAIISPVSPVVDWITNIVLSKNLVDDS
ncbi:unnamed protein product [Danaus chrysippus]|uniref:(African queen) hypothetical protein n=1 Tax=Danaus chrysippus TaxID=151541 RepID=A0A8J2VV46_9NEOP|nr:unnamed protein product [Danaus chrysippus]